MNKLILTAHHKNDAAIPIFKKYFYPIQVGSALNNVNLGIARDDFGENISTKNKNYCELTAYYNAYRNLNFDYAGLMHYRRIFSVKNLEFSDFKNNFIFYTKKLIDIFFSIKDLNLFLDNNLKIYSLKTLDKECHYFYEYLKKNNYDVIVPKKTKYAYVNLKNQYAINHSGNDFQKFNEIIINKYPLFSDVIESVNNNKMLYPYNMFVMKREIFMDYHDKLFNILEEMENYIELEKMNSYQARVFGFLSERFLNYYIAILRKDGQIKIKELRTSFVNCDTL